MVVKYFSLSLSSQGEKISRMSQIESDDILSPVRTGATGAPGVLVCHYLWALCVWTGPGLTELAMASPGRGRPGLNMTPGQVWGERSISQND